MCNYPFCVWRHSQKHLCGHHHAAILPWLFFQCFALSYNLSLFDVFMSVWKSCRNARRYPPKKSWNQEWSSTKWNKTKIPNLIINGVRYATRRSNFRQKLGSFEAIRSIFNAGICNFEVEGMMGARKNFPKLAPNFLWEEEGPI